MKVHEKINYVEFPSQDLEKTKSLFSRAFGWRFEDFGPEYTAFSNQGIDGGFFKSELSSSTDKGSALIVFFSSVWPVLLLPLSCHLPLIVLWK